MNNNEFMVGYKVLDPLSEAELQQYFMLVRDGNINARNIIIEHNLRLVLFRIYNKFKSVQYEKEDLVSIGIYGLIKAVNTFDISKNKKFTTYAIKCIDNEVLQFLRKMKKDQVVDSMDKVIYTKGFGVEELTLGDVLHNEVDLEEYVLSDCFNSDLWNLVNQLDIRDREIIRMHFGFYNNKIYKQSEIAERFGLSQSYVSRLIKRLLMCLRVSMGEVDEPETKSYSRKKV